jgi:hypothetical protein
MRRLLRPVSGRLRVALRAALVLSLWHAPIPWVHFHELPASPVESFDWLAEHVAEFHSADVEAGRTELDWHVHLVLPWTLNVQHSGCPDEQQESRPEDVCATATTANSNLSVGQLSGRSDSMALASWMIESTVSRAQLEIADVDPLRARGSGLHFFETYGSASALRTLTGVRVC